MIDFLILLTVAEVVWVVGFCVWIILERRSPAATLAWILGLVWLPYVGIAVYLLIGPRRLTRKRRRYAKARSRVREASAAGRRAGAEGLEGPAVDPRLSQFMQLVQRAGDAPPLRCRSLEIYSDGDACYASIEKAVAEARHHIHLEYYIWAADRVGTRLRDLLCRKARSGLKVRLLVDSIGSSRLGRRFLAPLRASGAEVAWFNPISLARFRPGLINFRTHRKIVVCDGRVGFTGGINVCDDHSEATVGHEAWRDTHVRIEGLPVVWLQSVFLEDWHFAAGGGPTSEAYFPGDDSPASGPWVQIVASGPDHDLYGIHKFYFSAIASARERVLVTTPYFVPDEPIHAALVTAALRGARVRLLVSKQGDSRLVTAAARSYYDELVRAGVAIYEYGPPMLHAKTLVVDRDIAVIGSANMDNRSFRLNFEIMAAVYDEATASRLAALFEEDLHKARKYSLREARRAPLRHRLIESTARLLSPLL
jgi:cardiolipin synthase